MPNRSALGCLLFLNFLYVIGLTLRKNKNKVNLCITIFLWVKKFGEMGGWDRKIKNNHMQEGFSAFGVKLFFIDFLRLVIFEKNIKDDRNCWSSLILIELVPFR